MFRFHQNLLIFTIFGYPQGLRGRREGERECDGRRRGVWREKRKEAEGERRKGDEKRREKKGLKIKSEFFPNYFCFAISLKCGKQCIYLIV